MVPLGSGTGVTSYTVSAGGAYSFVNYNGSQWYMVGTNGADHMTDYSSVALSAWGAAAANVAMGSNKITGLANGTASTDAAAFGQVSVKANSAITISTTAPLSGGGDLSADRTLTIADGTTSVKGVVQLTDSTSSTSTTTAATPNAVKTAYDLAAAALPKSGGTMSGAIAMATNRVSGLAASGASTDAARADYLPGVPNLNIHTGTYSMKAWTADPAQIGMTAATVTMSSGVTFFSAITIPFATTINQIWHYQQTGAVFQATAGYYAFGIYDTSGNLLASTGNQQSSGLCGLTGHLGWSLSSSYAIAAGNYMIGFLYYTGTGAGSPTTPIFGRSSAALAVSINVNCPTPSAGKLDQRACSAGSGRTTLYNPMTATPSAVNTNFWTALS